MQSQWHGLPRAGFGQLVLVFLDGLGPWAFPAALHGPSEASLAQLCLPLRQKRYPSEHAQTGRTRSDLQFVSKLRATAACGDAVRAVREVIGARGRDGKRIKNLSSARACRTVKGRKIKSFKIWATRKGLVRVSVSLLNFAITHLLQKWIMITVIKFSVHSVPVASVKFCEVFSWNFICYAIFNRRGKFRIHNIIVFFIWHGVQWTI